MSRNLFVFTAEAFFEIAGCFAFWAWLRRGASPLVVVAGVASLVAFAVALTRVDALFAGRAYAAYGGIYIAASLLWLWLVEGQPGEGVLVRHLRETHAAGVGKTFSITKSRLRMRRQQ